MTRILQLALILAALAAAFACTEVGLKARSETLTEIDGNAINREVTEAHKTNLLLNDPHNGIPAILADAHRTVIITGAAVRNIELGTRTWQKKQNAMADQAIEAEESLNAALRSLGTTADALSTLSQAQNQRLSALEEQLSTSVTMTQPAIGSLTSALSNASRASANIADTTASMDASAHDVQAFIHRETTPVRGTWNVIKSFLREFAGPSASVATAIK